MEQRLKAEMWDRMQYLFRNFYDRMVHTKLLYEGIIDVEVFRNALVYMMEKAPILHSSFHHHPVSPYWVVEKYAIGDVLTVRDVLPELLDEEIEACLTADMIPPEASTQIRVTLLQDGARTGLAIVVNHMCMDGGDFKYFLATLCENYNNLHAQKHNELRMKSGSRSYDSVYSLLDEEDTKTARGLYKNISKTADKQHFPWSPDAPEDKARIIRHIISEEEFIAMRKVCKKYGLTVNDAIITLMVRTLYEIGGYDETGSMTLHCAVDLRKHMHAESVGLTNHTSYLACQVKKKGATMQETMIEVVKSMRRHKKDKFIGLSSLPLLKLAYTAFPQAIAEVAIKIGYTNPLLAISNIGILNAAQLTFADTVLVDGFMTGAVKYKPFFMMSLTTLLNKVSLTIAIRGNEEDVKIAEHYFEIYHKQLEEFLRL